VCTWACASLEAHRGRDGTLSVATVLNIFSRSVVDWTWSATNDCHGTITALQMSKQRRGPDQRLFHYTELDGTYASADDQIVLTAQGIT
jgi:hypothetical protein